MGYFRFMDSKWIPWMLEGKLRVGSAQYYRLLEVFTGDEWIGDQEEARATGNTGAFSITPDNRDPATLQMVEQNHIAQVDPGATFIVNKGVQIRHSVPCYIQSMSVGDLSHLRPIMTDPSRPRYSYNGCVEIIDIDALCRHLVSHGQIDGRPFSDFFTGIEPDKVSYSGQLNDPWAAKIEANPFLKDKKYAPQSEYRIVFHARRETTGDHKIITFPEAHRFFRVSFENDGPASTSSPTDRRTKREIITHLANIQALMKSKRQESSDLFIRGGAEELEQSLRVQSKFEEDFSANHLRPLLDAYWALRRHHPSQEFDHALDGDLSASFLYNPLSQYLYGPHHMYWGNEFMWRSLSAREPEQCLYERLINDNTVPDF